MTRNLLFAVVKAAAERCGVAFYAGDIHRINADIRLSPALWLITPKVAECDGDKEGLRTYAVDMKLTGKCSDSDAGSIEKQWQEMEETAFRICREIASDECVKCTDCLTLDPGENSLTNRGELSISIKMNIQMPFRTPKTENICE